MAQLALKTIAEELGAKTIGNADLVVERLVHPSEASNRTDIVLAFDKSLHPLLEGTAAEAVIVAEDQNEIAARFKGAILVRRPRYAMASLTRLFARVDSTEAGIHPSAVVHETATIGKNVSIGPLCSIGAYAVIGDGTKLTAQVSIGARVHIGAHCLFYAGVRVGDDVQIGNDCIFQFNAVIGSDGFSFVTPEPGSAETAKASTSSTVEAFNTKIVRIHSLGAVIIGNDVEVGACTAIDRGTITHTRIGNGTKIDNQCQIGHNVEIGENCLLCGNVGVAGSTVIGDRVVLAARAGIADHLKIGSDAVLMAASQLGTNLPEKAIYMGFPAMPRERFMEQMIHLARLKNMSKRIQALEEKLSKVDTGDKKG